MNTVDSENSLKHTPGPWAVMDAPGELCVVTDRDTFHIATIADASTGRTPSDYANASLIARAPTMRAALERIADWAEERQLDLAGLSLMTVDAMRFRAIRDAARGALEAQP